MFCGRIQMKFPGWNTNETKYFLSVEANPYSGGRYIIQMDTSSLIRHWFHAEIPRWKFAKITSILKSESTWKLWHLFYMEILTWIRLLKLSKYWWVFQADFFMSFRRWIDLTSVLAVSILSFSNNFCSGNLF